MRLSPGATYYGRILTTNPFTGVLADADSTPTVAIYRNGSSISPTVTGPTSAGAGTGEYSYSFVIDAGYAADDVIRVVASATVAGVAGKRTNAELVLDAKTSTRAAPGDQMNLINAPNAVAIAAIQNGLATQADINALNQSASRRIILTAVEQFERPEGGTTSYTVEARTYDGDGAAVNADSTPTLTATGIVSGNLAANLSAASNPSTGVYRWTYTVANDAAIEQLRFDVSAVMGSTFTLTKYAQVTDFVAATFTTADRDTLTAIKAKTDLIATNSADSPAAQTAQTNAATAATQAQAANAKLLGNVAAQTGDAFARLGAPAGASVSADIAGVKGDSGAIAAILSGITSLPKWLRAMFRKSTADATALAEINSGGGSYDATTDSAEAMAEAIATVDATAGSAPTATEIWTHAQRSLTDGAIRVVSPFQSGSFAIVRGDSYLNADGNARSFGKVDGATWPTDLTGWTITFTCNPTDDLLETDSDAVGFTATGTVVTATGDSQAVRFDFTAAQTGALTPSVGGYKYDVQASKGNSRVTLETGVLTVVEDQTTG